MKKNVHFLLLWPTASSEINVVANVKGLQRGFWAISLVVIPLEYAPREEMQGLAYNWSLDWLISCMHTQARPGVDKVEPALAYRRLTHLTHGAGQARPGGMSGELIRLNPPYVIGGGWHTWQGWKLPGCREVNLILGQYNTRVGYNFVETQNI